MGWGKKLPTVDPSHKVMMRAESCHKGSEENKRGPGNRGIVHLYYWNWDQGIWGFLTETANNLERRIEKSAEKW